MTDAIGFITILEVNRLTKANFDARIKKAIKILASKTQVDTTLDKSGKTEKN